MVLCSHGMRCQEIDHFTRRETSVAHASEDLISRVKWLRDSAIRCGLGAVRSTGQELQSRAAATVGNTDCTSELDEISEGHAVVEGEGTLLVICEYVDVPDHTDDAHLQLQ